MRLVAVHISPFACNAFDDSFSSFVISLVCTVAQRRPAKRTALLTSSHVASVCMQARRRTMSDKAHRIFISRKRDTYNRHCQSWAPPFAMPKLPRSFAFSAMFCRSADRFSVVMPLCSRLDKLSVEFFVVSRKVLIIHRPSASASVRSSAHARWPKSGKQVYSSLVKKHPATRRLSSLQAVRHEVYMDSI